MRLLDSYLTIVPRRPTCIIDISALVAMWLEPMQHLFLADE